MKKYNIIGFLMFLSCIADLYSMKRDRELYEQKTDQSKEKEQENEESITKKIRLADSSGYVPEEGVQNAVVVQIEMAPIDQETGKPITLFTEEDKARAIEEIRELGVKINYPSLYIEELIEPELKRIDTNNFIVRLHLLPPELIEQILLLCMASFVSDLLKEKLGHFDTLGMFHALKHNCDFRGRKLFEVWERNKPYSKMFALLDAFPLKNICRGLMESRCFKQKLGQYMKDILTKFFNGNDVAAGKYLFDVVLSSKYLRDKIYNTGERFNKDVLLFARCLAESGLKPNKGCYLRCGNERREIYKEFSELPFCLLEFALYIGDYPFTKFLIDEKDGDITKVSKDLDCLINACRNDSIEMVKLILLDIWHHQNYFDEVSFKEGLLEAIKHKCNGVLGCFIKYIISRGYPLPEIQEFVNNGLDINMPNSSGRTALMIAVYYADLPLVKKLIEDWGANVNAIDNKGYSALFWCCKCKSHDDNKSLEIAKYLMEKGALCNIKDNTGMSLLHIAAKFGNEVLLKYLEDYLHEN